MRSPKLKLNLDDLAVDTFRTGAGLRRGGTVNGHELYYYERDDVHDTVWRETDPSGWNDTVARETQWVSCGGTCGTCGGTDCYA